MVLGRSKKSSRRHSYKSSSLYRQRQSRKKSAVSSLWLWGVGIAGIMLVWNWQLLLATLAGGSVLILLFQFPLDRWSVYWRKWQQQMNVSQRRLLIALTGSGLAGMGTYWAVKLWDYLDNPWLAGGAIAQGIILTLLLGLQLSKLFASNAASPQPDRFSKLVGELTADHALQRLMAIRELTQLAINGHLSTEQLQQVSEYFSLLFAVESEAMIRQRLLDNMQTLQSHQCWYNWESKSRQPLQKLEQLNKVPVTSQPD